jgi:hypothetical protein
MELIGKILTTNLILILTFGSILIILDELSCLSKKRLKKFIIYIFLILSFISFFGFPILLLIKVWY